MTDKERCSESVASPGSFGRFHQCTRRGLFSEGDKHYCKQHAPSAIGAKNKARNAKWDREQAIRKAESAVSQAATKIVEAVVRCNDIGVGLHHDITIALGHHADALARLAELKKEGGA